MSLVVAQQLRDALALIPTPAKWCRNAYAVDRRGRTTGAGDYNTCRRCAAAALAVITERDILGVVTTAAYQALERVILAEGAYTSETADLDPVEWFNDNRTHRDVVRMFKAAIEAEEATP